MTEHGNVFVRITAIGTESWVESPALAEFWAEVSIGSTLSCSTNKVALEAVPTVASQIFEPINTFCTHPSSSSVADALIRTVSSVRSTFI